MKTMTALGLIFVLSIGLLSGCNQSKPVQNTAQTQSNQTQNASDAAESPITKNKDNKSKPETLVQLTDEWTRVSKLHEAAINDYSGPALMQLMSLHAAGMPLVNCVFYELLNLENKEGRFEGSLGFSSEQGFIERKGNTITFGKDVILKEESTFPPYDKVGDRRVEKGLFEIDKGYLSYEDSLERSGNILKKNIDIYKYLNDGFITLGQHGIDINSSDQKSNSFIFLIMREKQYEFVTATSDIGASFKVLDFKDTMTVEEAKRLFEDLGYTIEITGSIEDGKLVVN